MTLERLVVAWIVIAAWFEVTTFVANRLVDRGVPPRLFAGRLVEALLITLIASLWFDSLGSGGSWLLFLLIGALVTSAKWFVVGPDPIPKRARFAETFFDLARYVIAGALLAWRLS